MSTFWFAYRKGAIEIEMSYHLPKISMWYIVFKNFVNFFLLPQNPVICRISGQKFLNKTYLIHSLIRFLNNFWHLLLRTNALFIITFNFVHILIFIEKGRFRYRCLIFQDFNVFVFVFVNFKCFNWSCFT